VERRPIESVWQSEQREIVSVVNSEKIRGARDDLGPVDPFDRRLSVAVYDVGISDSQRAVLAAIHKEA
jgi:hypothetical protein